MPSLTQDHKKPDPDPIALRAGWAFSLPLWALHAVAAVWVGDLQVGLMHGVTALYDTVILVCLGWALCFLSPSNARFANQVSFLAVAGAAMLLSTYPLLLVDSLRFPINVFDTDMAMAGFFVENLLGTSGVAAMPGVAICGSAVLWAGWPRGRLTGLSVALLAVGLGGIVGSYAGSVQSLSPHPHPLVYSLMETARPQGERVVAPVSAPESDIELSDLQPSPLSGTHTFLYDHLFIIVMETVETPKFVREFMQIEGGYFETVRDHSVFYENYYSPNLDSYTALIAMLTSQQVPYRAYDDPGRYALINAAPNLVSALNTAGYPGLFVCTAEHLPDVAGGENWTRVMLGGDFPNRDGFAEVTGNAIEAAAEDKIALPAILEFVSSHERSFVMHELVFGHSTRWQSLTGLAQLEYYDAYLQALWEGLQGADLQERALVVVVADHGERTDASNPARYHVPLLVSGTGIAPDRSSAFLSHLDLQTIIAQHLVGADPPTPRDEILMVGHSGRWTYGRLTRTGESHFIDARRGTLITEPAGLDPSQTREVFQYLVDGFARFQAIE